MDVIGIVVVVLDLTRITYAHYKAFAHIVCMYVCILSLQHKEQYVCSEITPYIPWQSLFIKLHLLEWNISHF